MNLNELLQHASPEVQALNRDQLPSIDDPLPHPVWGTAEHDMQVALFDWIDSHIDEYPALANAFAVPNGSDRHPVVARKLKAEGVRAGVPDVLLLAPSGNGRYRGMALELKVGRNQPTPEQQAWLEQLQTSGYYTVVVWDDWRTAAREIIEYLVGVS